MAGHLGAPAPREAFGTGLSFLSHVIPSVSPTKRQSGMINYQTVGLKFMFFSFVIGLCSFFKKKKSSFRKSKVSISTRIQVNASPQFVTLYGFIFIPEFNLRPSPKPQPTIYPKIILGSTGEGSWGTNM